MHLQLSSVSFTFCLALFANAAPTALAPSKFLALKLPSLSSKAFGETFTMQDWKPYVVRIADIRTNCNSHKDDILNGLAYARASASIAFGGTIAFGGNASIIDKVANALYFPEDLPQLSEMLYTTSRSSVHPSFTCPAEGKFDFKGGLASVRHTLTSEDINLSPALFKMSSLATQGRADEVDKLRHLSLAYVFLRELPQLESYAKLAVWPPSKCGKRRKVYGACNADLPSAERIKSEDDARRQILDIMVTDLKQGICLKARWAAYRRGDTTEPPATSTLKNPRSFSSFIALSVARRLMMHANSTTGKAQIVHLEQILEQAATQC